MRRAPANDPTSKPEQGPVDDRDEIDGIVESARAAWPGLEVATDSFVAYVRQRAADPSAHARMRAADLYLACACAGGDPKAMAAFERHCFGTVDRALGRLGMARDVSDEVKQRLRLKLFVSDAGPAKISSYSGRGDLRGWVRVLAVHEAMALGRYARRHIRIDDDRLAEAFAARENPELDHLKRGYRREFRLAFREALGKLTDHERLLLRQRFLDGLGIGEIAEAHGTHRTTVWRWLERARASVLDSTRARLKQRLGLASTEIDGLMHLIESQLDVSLRGLGFQGS